MGTVTRKRADTSGRRHSFLELVREFRLKPIRSKAEYDAASAVLDRLAVRGEADLDEGERDYLDTLALLVERYDDERHPMPAGGRRRTPLQVLKYLMTESGMSVSGLGKVIGSQPAASLILGGKRSPSEAHIRKIADHFRVSTDLFL